MEDYTWGEWTDSNGNVNTVRYKIKWGNHKFTSEEQKRLLSGEEISFKYPSGDITGHFQYHHYEGKEYFGFVPNFDKGYDLKPIYPKSLFKSDLKKSDVISEYMRLNYYSKLQNRDGTPVLDYQRVTDADMQKKGVDVLYTQNGKRFIIDEKAQMDYIDNEKGPLPTFALELLNSSSGTIGWFINPELETQYYMFIWPHAVKNKDLTIEDIEYVYYALVNKKKLKIEIEINFQKSPYVLLEYAKTFALTGLEGAEKVFNKDGKHIGYKYKKDRFNDNGYLYYTLNKQEKPVNLVVRRDWLERIAEDHGIITSRK